MGCKKKRLYGNGSWYATPYEDKLAQAMGGIGALLHGTAAGLDMFASNPIGEEKQDQQNTNAYGGNLFDSGGTMSKVAGYTDLAGSVADIFSKQSAIDESNVNTAKAQVGQRLAQPQTSNSLDSLMGNWASQNAAKSNWNYKDMHGTSNLGRLGSSFLGSLGTSAQGFQTGGMWGAIAGGVLGLGSGLFGMKRADSRAKKERDLANQWAKTANTTAANNMMANASLLDQNNDAMNLRSYIGADGGALNYGGGVFSDGVKEINTGGSHEENPYEGVQMGVAPDGAPNLVEEDERIYNNYVFSRRLTLPEADKQALGIHKKGKVSYAEAVDLINKESKERPNDPISKKGLNSTLEKLIQSQEAVRAEKKQLEQQEEMKRQGYANGGNLFDLGGFGRNSIYNTGTGVPNYMGLMSSVPRSTQAAPSQSFQVVDWGAPFVPTEQPEEAVPMVPQAPQTTATPNTFTAPSRNSIYTNALARATGIPDYMSLLNKIIPSAAPTEQEVPVSPEAQKEMLVSFGGRNPIYTNSNGVPDYLSLLPKEAAATPTTQETPAVESTSHSPALGGRNSIYTDEIAKRSGVPNYLGLFGHNGNGLVDINIPEITVPKRSKTSKGSSNTPRERTGTPIGYDTPDTLKATAAPITMKTPTQEEMKTSLEAQKGNLKDTNSKRGLPTWMRYAPIIGSGIQAVSDLFGLTNKPDYSHANAIENAANNMKQVTYTPTGQYQTYNPVDSLYALNQLQSDSNAARRAIRETSQNPSQALASLALANSQAQGAIGNAALQADAENNIRQNQVIAANNNIDAMNAQGALQADSANAQMDRYRVAAIQHAEALKAQQQQMAEAARAANYSTFLDNLGGLGSENLAFNMANDNEALKYAMLTSGSSPYKAKAGACGGYLTIKNKKKRK